MKTKTFTRFAPVLRERSARAPLKNTAEPRIQVHASFELDDDINDLGDAFLRGPVHQISFDLDAETGLDTLAEVYAYRVFRAARWKDDGRLRWSKLVLRFARDAFIVARTWGSASVFAATAEKAEAIFAEVTAVLGAVKKPEQPAFYMLRRDGGDIAVDSVTNMPEPLDDVFLRTAYGADAISWLADFASRTKARTGGLTILEGPPGTGKTSLVTEMIRRMRATHLFYVTPVNNDGILTSPDWMSFWQGQNRQHSDSVKVVVLEDAERILLGRTHTERDAVSAVLNIADGLLGRMLKVHLLCSINARFEELDPAIQRPGRLMNYRRFAPLPRASAAALAALKGVHFTPDEDADEFTLAEVLQPSPVPAKSGRKRVGFAR